MREMICLCDRTVCFEDDETEKTCECGFVLVLTEELTEAEWSEGRDPAEDYEPDVSDEGFDPYMGCYTDDC